MSIKFGEGQGDSFVEESNFRATIKSAATAASLICKGASGRRLDMWTAGRARLPCKSREAALAADLITA